METNKQPDPILLTPLEKAAIARRNQNIKLAATLVLSNLMVYLLATYQTNGNSPVAPVKSTMPAIREGHRRFKLPVKLYLPVGQGTEALLVSLFSSNKNPLVEKAFLLPPSPDNARKDRNLWSDDGDKVTEHIVEVSEQDIKKIIQYTGSFYSVFPHSKWTVPSKTEARSYEIVF